MQKNKLNMCALITIGFIAGMPYVAYANSSWYWFSETRPFDILPWVALVTIVVEWIMLWKIPDIKRWGKVLCAVAVANIASFLMPYLLIYIQSSTQESFKELLDTSPSYIVGIVFLIITCAVEIPIVNKVLKNDTQNGKRLFTVSIIANIITSLFAAILERLVTEGGWLA